MITHSKSLLTAAGVLFLWAATVVGQAWAASATLSPTTINITTSTTGATKLSGDDGRSAKTFSWSIPQGIAVTPGVHTNADVTLTTTTLTVKTKALGAFVVEWTVGSVVPGTYKMTNTKADISLSTKDITINVTGPSGQKAEIAPTQVAVQVSTSTISYKETVTLSGNDGLFKDRTFAWSIPSNLKVTAGTGTNVTYSVGSSSISVKTLGKGYFSAPMLVSSTRAGTYLLKNTRADLPMTAKDVTVTATVGPPGPQTRSFTLRLAESNWTIRPNMVLPGFWLIGGTLPGTEIRVNQGDTVKITFTNDHTQAHALRFRNGLTVTGDGVMVPAGGSYNYQFLADKPGTFYYTGEDAVATDRGMYGAIVIKSPQESPVFHDMVHFWDEIPRKWTNVNHPFPTYATHEFVINGKTMDSKVSGNNVTGNAPHGKVGQRSLVRLINTGVHTHAPHLHGHLNDIAPGDDPLAPQVPTDVAIALPGSVGHHYINARAAGTWMYHCHVETHLLNNPDGEYPGGMFTHVEVQ